jgi:hypothetical protein
VRLSTAGDAGVPFDLAACIVGPPEPIGDWAALLAARGAAQDVVLTWSNAVSTARIYLRMTTGIGTHGGISPVEIECEGPDTGSLRLPGPYLDALYAQGWSCGECGDNRLIRYHATEIQSGSRVIQLRTEAYAQFFFTP